jgi:transcriptional regulator with XRE-family HTH domain
MNDAHIVWARLDAARRAQKYTMKNLAKSIGISVNTISRDSKNPEKMPIGRLLSYCAALGLSIEDFTSKS